MTGYNKGYSLSALGVVNALGRGKESVWEALLSGATNRFTIWPHRVEDRDVLVADVPGDLPEIPERFFASNSRNNQLVLAALEEIEADVQVAIRTYGPERVGIVLGSSTSGIAEGDRALEQFDRTGNWPESYHLFQQEMGNVSDFLADYLGVAGPAFTISTACSSSAKVFASARNLINLGLCDAVITGGADSLCRMTVSGFSALGAVAESRCNPLSAHRDGLLIGEGAVLFLMEREGKGPRLLGVGESSDAYHMSAPDPEGKGAEAAMHRALDDAQLTPADISYVNLHGTATPHNDAMESKAVERIFGTGTMCSSTKPMTGHTLGAAGATEAAFCWLMLDRATDSLSVPPHCYDGMYDPELPKLTLAASRQTLNWEGSGAVISNSFAFGGNNCSLILGAGEATHAP